MIALPLSAFLDALIDALVAFNREHPGYLALTLASTLSAPLAAALAELQGGVLERLEAVFASLWPQGTPEQRRVPGLITYRLFLAVLPLALDQREGRQEEIVREMKAMMYRYWEPIIGAGRTAHASEPAMRIPMGER